MTFGPVPEEDLEAAHQMADSFAELRSEEMSGAIFAGLDQSNAMQWADAKAERVFPGISWARALIDQDRVYRNACELLTYDATKHSATTDPGPFSDDIPY